jgi:hypothetical protein
MKNQIQHTFTDPKTKKSQTIEMYLTDHVQERIIERGLSLDTLFYALEFGTEIYKQGLVFYVVLQKNLPDTLSSKKIQELNNIILVVDPNIAQIITCYKAKNASKHIKRKAKRLSRYAA